MPVIHHHAKRAQQGARRFFKMNRGKFMLFFIVAGTVALIFGIAEVGHILGALAVEQFATAMLDIEM